VVNNGKNDVTKLRTSDGSVLGTYSVGTYPREICFDGTNIWITNESGTVTKLRTSDGSVLATYSVGTTPQGICFDGTNIWVTNKGNNNVTKLTITPTASIAVTTPATVSKPSTGKIVSFPDANLQAAIRQAINKPAGAIYQSDLMTLTEFRPLNQNISNLAGLEYCTNLTYLFLSGNQISNISPLASLTNLTQLLLSSNKISDVSPLASRTNLTQLLLGGNQISDISPLASLTNLTRLELSINPLKNISPVAFLTNLHQIDLDYTQITDISPLLANSGFSTGDYIYLNNNSLSATSINVYIPQLRSRGVTVIYP
jgi:Leucine-rich repeat (LRR) protein